MFMHLFVWTDFSIVIIRRGPMRPARRAILHGVSPPRYRVPFGGQVHRLVLSPSLSTFGEVAVRQKTWFGKSPGVEDGNVRNDLSFSCTVVEGASIMSIGLRSSAEPSSPMVVTSKAAAQT